jgi:dipeptidase E
MGKIVAIGGGEIARSDDNISETLDIDNDIKNMTGKKNPRLVFLPTASNDSQTYINTIHNYFGKKLGCKVSSLEVAIKDYTFKELEISILHADIVYVGGGNTRMMLEKWKMAHLDQILIKSYYETDIILSGVSAGASCWFKYGSSDSNKINNDSDRLMCLPGLGLINLSISPHHNSETDRRSYFQEMLSLTKNTGIGLDNCCAISIDGDNYKIISSRDNAYAWVSKWNNNYFQEEKLGDGITGRLIDL